MQLAFIVDPLPSLVPHHDTSVALMQAAHARRHQVFALEVGDLRFEQGETWGRVQHLALTDGADPWYEVVATTDLPLSQMQAVWLRKDPPVDGAYLTATHLLDLIPPPTLVLNHPAGLRSANEKLYALQFTDWIPRTLVTADKGVIKAFVADQGKTVLKPLGGKGGEGIFILEPGDRNLSSLIEVSTQFGRTPVMVQEYLPAAADGDKRILLLDGKPLGAVNRLPGQGDFRGNIAAGGRVAPVGITAAEEAMCAAIAPVLQAAQLYFVGIDVIGEKLTEINVTSPTMLREMSDLNGADLATQVLVWLEKKIQTLS